MHEAQIRVAIVGAGGRMGRQLIQAALHMEGIQPGARWSGRALHCWAAMRASWRAWGKWA